MNKRRCTFEAEQFFHSNLYMFKRKQKWRRLINIWSAGHLIPVSALKEHFDTYLYFSLNDRLLISVFLLFLSNHIQWRECNTESYQRSKPSSLSNKRQPLLLWTFESLTHSHLSSQELLYHIYQYTTTIKINVCSYCVVILRTPPYWSVRVALCNFKLGG